MAGMSFGSTLGNMATTRKSTERLFLPIGVSNMASVIWKYGPFNMANSLPVCGEPIKLDIQNDLLHCWCLVELNEDGHPDSSWKSVRIAATGETFVGRYIDTVQDKYGLVWHLIEE